MHEPYRLKNVEMRWLNPENPDGARHAGGTEGFGRKGRPCRGALPAGETWVLGEGQGVGTIRRMWFTASERGPEVLRGVVLRITWDGAQRPAVDVPLADFCGNPHGRAHRFANLWFNNPEGRNWNCTVPMPFRKSFRIEVTNESSVNIRMFWYHIDYTLGDAHGVDTGYFHAYWNRENPTTLRRDFRILPPVQGRGRYLGCALGLITRPSYRAWWGEGEVKVYLDGDTDFPTLCGTGTEDYICTAWGTGSFSLPEYGCQLLESADPDRQQISMYRLHASDPVYFQREIRVELQQIGYWGGEGSLEQMMATGQKTVMPAAQDGLVAYPLEQVHREHTPLSIFERQDDWCATAYFYLDRAESGLPPLAPPAERIADLTGEPTAADGLVARLERLLLGLPSASAMPERLAGRTAEERGKHLLRWQSAAKALAQAVQEVQCEIASHPESAHTERLRTLLAASASAGFLRADYGAAIRRFQKAIERDPTVPIVLTEFKASALRPAGMGIEHVPAPKPGALKHTVPFVAATELADIRDLHQGADGLLYLETAVSLAEGTQGGLWYGADGPVKVWVNGRVVDCRPHATIPAVIGQYRVSVAWRKGVNRIVFAMHTNQGRSWGVVARAMRAQ